MRAGERLVILVADDSEVNLKVISGMLEFAGHEVDVAGSGEAALVALERKHYQLLILDCMMPGLDGFQVARKIRAGDGSLCDPEIPILAVTALATERDRKRCQEAGMTGFCTKPLHAAELFSWIAKEFDFQQPPAGASLQVGEVNGRKEYPTTKQTDLTRNLSSMLIRDMADWQLHLPKLLTADKSHELTMLAHKIKGTADILGFQDLSFKAAILEQSSKSGIDSDSHTQVSQLIVALQQLTQDIRERP